MPRAPIETYRLVASERREHHGSSVVRTEYPAPRDYRWRLSLLADDRIRVETFGDPDFADDGDLFGAVICGDAPDTFEMKVDTAPFGMGLRVDGNVTGQRQECPPFFLSRPTATTYSFNSRDFGQPSLVVTFFFELGRNDVSHLLTFARVPPAVAENLDLETQPATGAMPYGWTFFGRTNGYRTGIDLTTYRSGKASVRLYSGDDPLRGGSLTQCIEAEPYRGRRVRWSGYLETPADQELATYLTLGEHGRSSSTPLHAPDWTRQVVEADVAENATQLCFGLTLENRGEVWGDDFALETVAQ